MNVRTLETIALFSGAAGALAIALVACASFSGGDGPSAPADDAARPPDPSTDGLLPDGAAVPFDCKSHSNDQGFLYCNDFELPTESIYPFGFTSSTAPDSGARIAVVEDGDRAHVLTVKLTLPTTGSRDVTLMQELPIVGPPPSLQLDFDVKIVTDDLSGVTLADLHLAGNSCEASFGLGAFGAKNVGTTRNPGIQLPYSTEWRHVTVALLADATSSTGYREVSSYGGTPFADRPVSASSGGSLTGCNSYALRLGLLEYGGTGPSADVRYDNILVRRLP